VNGLLVLDKPDGMTSHDVVSRVRRILGTRKVGHAGTLDPMATGLLIIGVGRATRLLGYISGADKTYTATIRLGRTTTTDDAEGEPLATADRALLDALDIATVLNGIDVLTGEIMQVPSSVSAIKVDGKRAYALARAGDEVILAPRSVTVTEFVLLEHRYADPWLDLDVRVTCSSGTYVRALARDLGDELGVGGHLTALRRTKLGAWDIADSLTLDALEHDDAPGSRLISMSASAARVFPRWKVSDDQAAMVRNGRRIDWRYDDSADPVVAIFDSEDNFLALAEQHGPTAKYLAVFV